MNFILITVVLYNHTCIAHYIKQSIWELLHLLINEF